MVRLAVVTGLWLVIFATYAAEIPAPSIQWQIAYGGTGSDELHTALETADGGYLLVGWSGSTVSGNRTVERLETEGSWVVRLGPDRNDLWQKSITPRTYGALETTDRGFILWGEKRVLKLNASGLKAWEYTNTAGFFWDGILLSDGGLLVCGSSGGWGVEDGLLVRLGADGSLIWQRTLGGPSVDVFVGLVRISPGEFWLAGYSSSAPGVDKTAPKRGYQDIWLVAVNANGERLWDQTFGGTNRMEYGIDIAINHEGTVALAGHMDPLHSDAAVFGRQDAHLLLFNSSGFLLTEAFHGCSDWDSPIRIIALPDGGFAMAVASTPLTDGNKIAPGFGREDWWLLRLDRSGNRLWEKCLGGLEDDRPMSMMLTKDFGLLVGGRSNSGVGGSKTIAPYGGNYDYWVVKLASDAMCTPPKLRVLRQSASSIAENGFEMFLTGSSNLLYALEWSTNLATWTPFATNVASGVENRVVDQSVGGAGVRAYRARLIP